MELNKIPGWENMSWLQFTDYCIDHCISRLEFMYGIEFSLVEITEEMLKEAQEFYKTVKEIS